MIIYIGYQNANRTQETPKPYALSALLKTTNCLQCIARNHAQAISLRHEINHIPRGHHVHALQFNIERMP